MPFSSTSLTSSKEEKWHETRSVQPKPLKHSSFKENHRNTFKGYYGDQIFFCCHFLFLTLMYVMRAQLTTNANAWDGEVISNWPLIGVFNASLKCLPTQLFSGLKRLASGSYFATLTYSLTTSGDVVPYFWMSEGPLPVAWTRSRHALVV